MRSFVVVLMLVLVLAVHASARAQATDPRVTFRKRNPQHFTVLELDASGRIRHVRTDDRELAGPDDFMLRGWLQQNADLLGGRAEDNDPRRGTDALAYYLLDPDQGQITGAAIVHRARGVLDVTIVRATRSPDAAARALVGTRHVQTLRYGDVPQRDCNMGARPNACRPRVTATRQRPVVLSAEEVVAQLQLRVIRGAVRLIVCVSAEAQTPDDPRALISASLSGVPFAVEAETGAQLPVSSCVPDL